MSLQCEENENMSECMYLEDCFRSLPHPQSIQARTTTPISPSARGLTCRHSPAPHQLLAAAAGVSALPEASLRSVLGSGCAQRDTLCVGRQKEVIRNV